MRECGSAGVRECGGCHDAKLIMKITRFEDLEAWKAARELTRTVYELSKKGEFSKDFGLKDQIRRAAGSVMHNIAEGFDSGSRLEFQRFLRYANRSCSEVRSQLYVALDQEYLTEAAFNQISEHCTGTSRIIRGLIRYLKSRPSK